MERLWPRGLSKEAARVDRWAKEAAPSAALRRWFDHAPERWEAFKERYFAELRGREEALEPIREALAEGGPVTFVFASREERFNNAVALAEYLEGGPSRRRPK